MSATKCHLNLMVETVSKRLHISGLTPALTASDIKSRFSAFGTVSDITGFGSLDANGNTKKFAYLTLIATEDKLRRCLSSLSGTVWKGAKLRIGDARPDYKERYFRDIVLYKAYSVVQNTEGTGRSKAAR